ncbi:unnamed protein product [Symbiodinium sp. CCMP2592]|nr:unnamed protein product [Symbiodinium sp. CCMP2592]
MEGECPSTSEVHSEVRLLQLGRNLDRWKQRLSADLEGACLQFAALQVGDRLLQGSEEFGLHPDSMEWLSSTKMMIRNVPARCTELELRVYLSTQTTHDFVLEMPKTSPAKCKGYAFVQMDDSVALAALAKALWQQTVPTRKSARAFKIHPAESAEKLPLSLEPFSFFV